MENLEGKRFGKLIVLSDIMRHPGSNRIMWLCKCDCGNTRYVAAQHLKYYTKKGTVMSCGCTRGKFPTHPGMRTEDLSKRKIGKLTVSDKWEIRGEGKRQHTYWLCTCDCGITKWMRGSQLKYLITKQGDVSCGCNRRKFGSIRKVYMAYKHRAKKFNREFNLTFEEFVNITTKNCYYCDSPPENRQKDKNKKYTSGDILYNGIDRKNNRKGYTVGNSVPCCFRCNVAKNDSSLKEFMEWSEKLHTHLNNLPK